MKKQPNRGPFLLETRKNLGLSQKEFARLLGVSQAAVCMWERGVADPGRLVFMTGVLASKYQVAARTALDWTTPRVPFGVIIRHYQARRSELKVYFGRDLALEHEAATRLATLLDLIVLTEPDEVERGRAWWAGLRKINLLGELEDD